MTLARFEKIGIGPLNTRAAQGTLTPGTTYQTDEGAYLANTAYTFTAIGSSSEESVFVGPPRWVTGTEYTTGQYVISPLSWHQYIRKTDGAGSIDPANDKTNWELVGAGGIKSIQRGTTNASTAATVTITAVDPANSVVSLLGQSSTDASFIHAVRISLESPTILRVYRAGGGTGITVTASWQVVEYWS